MSEILISKEVQAAAPTGFAPRPSMRKIYWLLLVAALYAPAGVYFAAHFMIADDIGTPTGFLQPDMPYYMANAREYLDGGTDGLRYALPFSDDPNNKPIHFQPQIAVLAFIWHVSGFDPGHLFVAFGVVFGLLCVHAALKLLEHVLPREGFSFAIHGLLFLWGGGVLFAVGVTYGHVTGEATIDALKNAFRFDPKGGWWCLNLGRTLIYPFEAYYHFLYFMIALSIVRKKYVRMLLLALLLAFSHPFTGMATLMLLVGWLAIERFIFRSRRIPDVLLIGTCVIAILATSHYFIVLPMNEEHRTIIQQWKISWTQGPQNFIPAYIVVGLIAFLAVRFTGLKRFIKYPFHRYLICWVLVWFGLENHQIFFTPHQPLHFTRGYTWSALFLIGAPVIPVMLRSITTRVGPMARPVLISSFVLLFLLDNLMWMSHQIRGNYRGTSHTFILTNDARELMGWLAQNSSNALLIAEDREIAYLAMVYTSMRSYCSHGYLTPDSEQRVENLEAYFSGRPVDDITARKALVIASISERPFIFAEKGDLVFENASFAAYNMSSDRFIDE